MARHLAKVGTLSIPNAGTVSPALTSLKLGKSSLGLSTGIAIHAPAALTGTVTVQAQPQGDSTWRTLQTAGADVTVNAGKTLILSPVPVGDLRLSSTVGEAAQRDFLIEAQEDTA